MLPFRILSATSRLAPRMSMSASTLQLLLPSGPVGRRFASYNAGHSQPIAVKLGGGGDRGVGGPLGFPPTYDELPVPGGDWQKFYKQQDDKYTKHLIVGLGMFCVTIYAVSQMVDFNFFPPPLGDEEDDLCNAQKKAQQPKCS